MENNVIALESRLDPFELPPIPPARTSLLRAFREAAIATCKFAPTMILIGAAGYALHDEFATQVFTAKAAFVVQAAAGALASTYAYNFNQIYLAPIRQRIEKLNKRVKLLENYPDP